MIGRRLTRAMLAALACLLLLPAWSLQAATLLAVVSPRNAADLAGGAHRFLDETSGHRVLLRSTEQLAALDAPARRELLASADVVLAGGVFGVAAERLLESLAVPAGTAGALDTFVALHGDPRLTTASRLDGRPLLAGADIGALMTEPPPDANLDTDAWIAERLETHAEHRDWLLAKLFWSGRDPTNLAGLMRHLATLAGAPIDVPSPTLEPSLRAFTDDTERELDGLALDDERLWVAILDHETGDRPGEIDLHRALCRRIEAAGHGCLSLLARWGDASVAAVERLADRADRVAAVVSLQDFVIGAGEGRARVDAELARLDVPVLKGIRLSDVTEGEWRLSEEGLPQDTIHYRIAMPELQGVSQPLVVSAATPPTIDPRTGLELVAPVPIGDQVDLLARRVNRWLALRTTPVAERRVAIVYYNHPPGRHNIGADNLNVPASLLEILRRLEREGHDTGPLPESEEALLDLLQERGVNLPEDRTALAAMAPKVTRVDTATYAEWHAALPATLRGEMVDGPLGYLQGAIDQALALDDPSVREGVARGMLERVVLDLRHAVEGAEHPARERVLALLDQLHASYDTALDPTTAAPERDAALARADDRVSAIVAAGIEGVRGWGEPPGRVMVHDGEILLPGIRFGNVFVGPQPPRGWELNEELLHANLSFPPTHQYVAFHQWLRNDFEADAIVHLGRHSTLEFLPRHRAGLGRDDYPSALLDDLPNVYPYIVDGVGEGIQAKRRGLAVMVDHLTPPLESTALYDRLLELRQLVESHEAAPASATAMRTRATRAIRSLVADLELEDALLSSMAGELEVRGITGFAQIDEELLVHEVGHYLTELQEDFMPLGLHVFGRPWSDEAVDTMLGSMSRDVAPEGVGDVIAESAGDEVVTDESTVQRWRTDLVASPDAEMDAFLGALSGRYVRPGKGNDPIRTPEVLPTGRNFFAIDGGLVPSRLGYRAGVELAARARALAPTTDTAMSDPLPADADAIVLWASDVVRDEGAMIAFGLDMLGVRPVWSSRGIVRGLERLAIGETEENGAPRVRRDTVFTTSGLFRDLYGPQLVRLEQAVLMALDASSNVIRRDYPALAVALEAALAPLGEARDAGDEPLAVNRVAARWTTDAARALREGRTATEAGPMSAYRVFGDAPGTYGAGVNRLVERSGSWERRSEVAEAYRGRMSHAYGSELQGEPRREAFERRLESVARTYAGQSSNLYGLLDNNDMFDYLGGLSLAVESLRGEVPENFVLQHADGDDVRVEPLASALTSELRGRFLNPQWLVPMMDEGYAGARTMGSEFVEYLWGWQVTNPEIVRGGLWDEVKRVYVDDAHDIGLDAFLEEGHNVHVMSNVLAVMLVAAQKGFWDADEATLGELAERYVRLVVENGLPGSGHTSADHPMHAWLERHVDADAHARLQALLDETRPAPAAPGAPSPTTIAEITMADSETATANGATASAPTGADAASSADTEAGSSDPSDRADVAPVAIEQAVGPEVRTGGETVTASPYGPIALGALAVLLGIGLWRGARGPALATPAKGS